MIPITRVFEAVVCTAFYAGVCYMLFDGAARKLRTSPLLMPPPPKLVLVTAVHDQPCTYPRGDYLNYISVLNKQDYARLHGYKCMAPSQLADPRLKFMWNKVAWLLQAMDDYPDAEWYLWIDSDTMIIDVSFTLPFWSYDGKDLVIWGNETKLLQGDGRHGMNSGVMLFRNTRWSREFLQGIAEIGLIPEPFLGQRLREQLTAPGYVYDPGLRDQNAIVYTLKKEWARHHQHVLTINRQYCMNCYWRDLLELGDLRSDESRVHFINHFSGCQMCTEQNKNSDYKECETEFVKSFEYANSIMMKMLARKPARNLTSHEQLAALPYCKANPTSRECRQSVNAVQMAAEGMVMDERGRLTAAAIQPPVRSQKLTQPQQTLSQQRLTQPQQTLTQQRLTQPQQKLTQPSSVGSASRVGKLLQPAA